MKELTHLANKYQSDKGTIYSSKHNFSDIYDDYFFDFKYKNINILEIGVHDGASLKMWYEYFPNANIIGMDIDDKRYLDNDRIHCGILDQSNKEHLKEFSDNINLKFDIIIDDGSHHMSDQQLTFGYLFNILNPCGLYIIEDLHTSLCDAGTILYGRVVENNKENSNTTLNYLKNKPYISDYLSSEQNEYVQTNVSEVLIFKRHNSDVPNDYKNQSITSVIKRKC